MNQLTGTGLAEFALQRVGMPYFYGAKITHGVLTEDFMMEMHRKFSDFIDAEYLQKARQQEQIGKINVDCSGLIGAYRGRERSSAQLYATAYVRLPMEKVEDFAVGTVLWKPGHVGIYIGNEDYVGENAQKYGNGPINVEEKKEKYNNKPICVEAKGIKYGVIISKVEDTDWKAGLTFPDLKYSYTKKIAGTWKEKNPYLEPMAVVMHPDQASDFRGRKSITYGEGVRWLQWELKEAGYDLEVDGVFGAETKKAVSAFQTSCELFPDGIVDQKLKKYLTVIT